MESLPAVVEIRPLDVEEQPEAELQRRPGPALPAVQAAAAVAGGLVAGAATVALARRAAGRGRRRRDMRRVEIVSSRSFLVDVHVIDHP